MNPKFCSKKQLASCPYKNTYFCQKHLYICTYSEQKMESEKTAALKVKFLRIYIEIPQIYVLLCAYIVNPMFGHLNNEGKLISTNLWL